jgi:hypothetical protein
MRSYDSYGWLSAEEIPGRTTSIEPPAHGAAPVVGEPWPNYTGSKEPGKEWVLVPYSEPPVIAPPAPPRKTIFTKKEMLLRITPAEYAAIKASAAVDSTVDYFWQIFTLADEVDTDDPVTIQGFTLLEAVGILSAGRASEILA